LFLQLFLVVSAITVKPAITNLTIPNVNWKPVINWKVNFFHIFCDAISEISSRRIFLGFWYVIIHDITSLFWKNQLYNIFSVFLLMLLDYIPAFTSCWSFCMLSFTTPCLKNAPYFFSNNSVKNERMWIIFGTRNPEEI